MTIIQKSPDPGLHPLDVEKKRLNPPTDADHEHAVLILDHIQRLRDLGAFAQEPTRAAEINFIATMLRNERECAYIQQG